MWFSGAEFSSLNSLAYDFGALQLKPCFNRYNEFVADTMLRPQRRDSNDTKV